MRLLERESLLTALDGQLAEVSGGSGRVVMLSGEAGVGKTALVEEWSRQTSNLRVLRGACDGSATPRALGPFLDAIPGLSGVEDGADRGSLVATVVSALAPTEGRATVLILEDVHWADEATLDLLRSLTNRLTDLPVLVLVTYRSDEVGPAHPLAILIGDLAGRPSLTVVQVPPLTIGAVRALARLANLSDSDAEQLHHRTGGNAFYVTEVLESGGAELPATVRDAVRARVARLSPQSREALDVVALVGQRAEFEVVEDVLGEQEMQAADEAIARGVLHVGPEGLQFRHDLARTTIAQDVPPIRRVALHRAILQSLQRHPALADPARVAHHAEEGREPEVARAAALEAASCSARLGAHREAVLQYERALRLTSGGDAERVGPLESLGYELYLTGRIDDAITMRTEVLRIETERGERTGIATSHRWLSRLHWFAGHGASAEAHAQRALELLVPGEPSVEAAMALSNVAQLRMLAGEVEEARTYGHQAMAMARFIGSEDVLVHAMNNVGTAELFVDETESGRPLLEESLERAIAADFHEHAARAYTNLVSSAVVARRLDEAERWAGPAIQYCADSDLDTWRLYIEGYAALSALYRGRFSAALELADRVLAVTSVPDVSRITPLVVRGLARARTGAAGAAGALLEATRIAERSGEVQRLDLTACALTELAWLERREPPESLQSAFDRSPLPGSPWRLGEMAVWLSRYNRLDAVPEHVARPYQLELAGEPVEAAEAWAQLGCPYDEALARGRSNDVEQLTRAVRALNDLGATPAAARVGARLAELGGPVPRPRRRATRTHPAGLTEREAEVLSLLASGATNSRIATDLGISSRTAEHHVSSVLTKLEAPTRTEAVAKAVDRGWVERAQPS